MKKKIPKRPAKPAKKPKIVQVVGTEFGIGIVLYDNGRVFQKMFEMIPLPRGGHGQRLVWREIEYPLN